MANEKKESQKFGMGSILVIVGLLFGFYAMLMFETSVHLQNEGRVENIGLLNTKLCYIVIAGFLFLGGVILMAAPDDRAEPGTKTGAGGGDRGGEAPAPGENGG